MILFRKLIITLGACACMHTAGYAQEDSTGTPDISGNNKMNAIALHYDAVRARQKGDNTQAEDLLRKAMAFDPDGAGLYYDLARLQMARKQTSDAEKSIKKAIKLAPDNKWYKEQYAILLLDANKFKQAAEVYEEILAADENNKEYLQTIAYLYQRAGDNKKAEAAFDKLLQMYGDNEEILEAKLQLYLNNNELEKAVEINNLLIKIDPSESRYYIRLAEMYHNNNEEDKAAEVYKKAEQMFPDDAGIQLSLSQYYKNKGDKENYKKYLRKVVVNNSLDNTEQLSVLGGFLVTAKDSADRAFGLEIAGELAKQNPDDAKLVAAYGDMLGITDHMEEAAEQYKKSLDMEPSNYLVWKNLLSVYLQEQQNDSLIKYSQRALRIFPNQAQLHYLSGLGYNFNKQYDKAVNAIERATDMTPEENTGELAGMYAILGDIYNSTKEYKLSDENFDKALKLDPENPTTLNNYAYYLSERNERLDDAKKMSEKSLELVPDMPTFLDTYGWILYKKGDYKKAKDYIEKAIEKEDEAASATLWDHLGDVYNALKNKEKALECWLKAKELGLEGAEIDKKLKEKA